MDQLYIVGGVSGAVLVVGFIATILKLNDRFVPKKEFEAWKQGRDSLCVDNRKGYLAKVDTLEKDLKESIKTHDLDKVVTANKEVHNVLFGKNKEVELQLANVNDKIHAIEINGVSIKKDTEMVLGKLNTFLGVFNRANDKMDTAIQEVNELKLSMKEKV